MDWADLPSCVGCISLENTTYPDNDVASYINNYFVRLQLNRSQNSQLFKENKIIWTPTLTICNPQGAEQYRRVGYLPPEVFLPKVKFAHAWLAIASQEWSQATDLLDEVTSIHSKSLVAPEALYWLGVARWKIGRKFDDLSKPWADLMDRYPGSQAALKASCLALVSS
ncbi:MAG TPA: thioredoxin fold domain-containing protein [Pyrinomonadaceae bacterium]|nr:thioredoxin fold domain-containing protein [Pyrinomonadaceae bacterium]